MRQRGLFGERTDGGITGAQRELPLPAESELDRYTREQDARKQPPSDELWSQLVPPRRKRERA